MTNHRSLLYIFTLLVAAALLIAACGSAAPTTAAPTAPVDVVAAFYTALNDKNVEKAMTLTAEDYVMNDPFGTYDRAAAAVQWQAVVDAGLSFKQTDFKDTGNGRVTSCYEVFENGTSIDKGCNNVTHVQAGKIIFDGLESAERVWVVQRYYAALNAKELDKAVSFVAADAVFANPTGKYDGADEIRASLKEGIDAGITFDLSNFRELSGRVVYDYKVVIGPDLLDEGTDGLTIIKDGKIIFDGTERTEIK